MNNELSTPLGRVLVYVNGVLSKYEFLPYNCNIKALQENPITACYKISVSGQEAQTVQCMIELDCEEISTNWNSDERYLEVDFCKNNIIVTIGAEADNAGFDTQSLQCGIQYVLKSSVEFLIFSIAWATDYQDEFDIRTYLATDIF